MGRQIDRSLKHDLCEQKLEKLQAEFWRLQGWGKILGTRRAVVLEGHDAAGKVDWSMR